MSVGLVSKMVGYGEQFHAVDTSAFSFRHVYQMKNSGAEFDLADAVWCVDIFPLIPQAL